jgi:hypothetical protein
MAARQLNLGSLTEILPAGFGVEGTVEDERSSCTMVRAGGRSRVAGPDALTCGRRCKEGPARHGRASGLGSGCGVHRRECGVPPGPDLPLRLVPVRAVGEDPEDVEGAGCGVAEIACGSGPAVGVGLDEAVAAEPAEDRRGVASADAEDPGGAIDCEGGVLAEGGVEPAGGAPALQAPPARALRRRPAARRHLRRR